MFSLKRMVYLIALKSKRTQMTELPATKTFIRMIRVLEA